ncbi:MAG: hypothetical protein WBL19_03200 [Minisyncoccia bacterium]
MNPFAFGAANFALFGPEWFLYHLLAENYEKAGRVIKGTSEQLIEAALASEECHWSKDELTKAIDNLRTGDKGGGRLDALPLISLDEYDMVVPTKKFGIMETS